MDEFLKDAFFFNKLINFFYSYDFYKKDDYDFESTILLNLDDIFRHISILILTLIVAQKFTLQNTQIARKI